MTSEKKTEYQLVLIRPGKEEILFSSPNRLEAELQRERHIRSITPGFVEIREA